MNIKIKKKASLEFEPEIAFKIKPKIKVERNIDGKNGFAILTFDINESIENDQLSKIKMIRMKDSEGELISNEIKINNNEDNTISLNIKYRWFSRLEFERFLRFAKSYLSNN